MKRKAVCDIWAIPEFPSGRKVAVDCSPLRDAIDRVVASGQANQLLTFKKHNLICQLLDVVEIYKDPLVPEEEQEEVEVSPGKLERFLTKHTGFTASEFMEGGCDWSAEDVQAFKLGLCQPLILARLMNRQEELNDALGFMLNLSSLMPRDPMFHWRWHGTWQKGK